MADNFANVSLEANLPVDLYDVTGITVGTKIEVQNIGCVDVILFSQLASPVVNDGHQVIARGEYMENDEDDLGAWAIARSQDGKLNVKVAL